MSHQAASPTPRSSAETLPPGPRIGRDGYLRLRFESRDGRTVLTGRRFTLPLQALEPMDLDGSGGLALLLLNPTGGILGGDVLDTEVTVGPGARVVLGTPSATRVYRTAGPPAVQRFTATVGEGAALEYVPDHVIPSPGARFHQRTEVRLAPGATVLLLDAWCAGRPARGEAWRFAELDLALAVGDDRGPLLIERARLTAEARWAGLGAAEGRPYVASFAALAPARRDWARLADEIGACLEDIARPWAGLVSGVTVLGRGGLLARILAPSAPALHAAVAAMWGAGRRLLLGAAPLSLRK